MALPEQKSDCSSLLVYRLRKDERLSWLTCSGRFTHITGHSVVIIIVIVVVLGLIILINIIINV